MSFFRHHANDSQSYQPSLWQCFKEGDRGAFDTLIRQHYAALFSYGLKFSKDRELLKDVLHDAFITLWHNRHLVNIDKNPYFYLLTIFRNQLIKSLQLSYILDEEPLHNLTDDSIEVQIIHTEDSEKIQSLIQKLPTRHQEALHLRFFEELDHDQIAELMQINKQSIANLVYSGLKMLREMWGAVLILVILFLDM